MPPLGALIWPSSEVPVPKAMIGVLRRAHSWTICCTSSADSANTTASGRWASWNEMSLPCCSRTAGAVLTRSPKSCFSSAIVASTLAALVWTCTAI